MVNTISPVVPEEAGYFDLIEEYYTAVELTTSSLGKMSEYTTHIGEQFSIHTESAKNLMEKYGDKPKVSGSREAQKYLTNVYKFAPNFLCLVSHLNDTLRPVRSIEVPFFYLCQGK